MGGFISYAIIEGVGRRFSFSLIYLLVQETFGHKFSPIVKWLLLEHSLGKDILLTAR